MKKEHLLNFNSFSVSILIRPYIHHYYTHNQQQVYCRNLKPPFSLVTILHKSVNYGGQKCYNFKTLNNCYKVCDSDWWWLCCSWLQASCAALGQPCPQLLPPNLPYWSELPLIIRIRLLSSSGPGPGLIL